MIYLEQFGGWWSFTVIEWKAMLKDWLEIKQRQKEDPKFRLSVEGLNYNSYGKPLRNKLYQRVKFYSTINREGYRKTTDTSLDSSTFVYSMPCDWNDEQLFDVMKQWNILQPE